MKKVQKLGMGFMVAAIFASTATMHGSAFISRLQGYLPWSTGATLERIQYTQPFLVELGRIPPLGLTITEKLARSTLENDERNYLTRIRNLLLKMPRTPDDVRHYLEFRDSYPHGMGIGKQLAILAENHPFAKQQCMQQQLNSQQQQINILTQLLTPPSPTLGTRIMQIFGGLLTLGSIIAQIKQLKSIGRPSEKKPRATPFAQAQQEIHGLRLELQHAEHPLHKKDILDRIAAQRALIEQLTPKKAESSPEPAASA